MKTPLLALALAAAGSLLAMPRPAAAEATKLASITIVTPDAVRVLPLSVGQPRLYDSNPLRSIEKVRPDLEGAQFTAIPQRIINQYQIRVDTPGVLYTFGGKVNTHPTRAEFLGENDPRWVQDDGAVEGKNLVACYRRKVAAGEIISVQGFELELAASGISTATTLTAPLAPVAANAPPSRQIEPLLDPCLNAILAPLEQNPQMPRIAVEKLQATLGAGLVTAKTPARQQTYQCAITVCESLTSGMDERAQTRAAAEASGLLPPVSNGASIVKTSPLHGRDASGAAEAIRQKQKDERHYADSHARALSNFMESSAYKAWVTRSANLRENAMSLYTKLVQLESAEPFPETGTAGATPPANPALGASQPLPAASTSAPFDTAGGEIQISSAIWQGPQPSQSIDVTQRIRELLDTGVTAVTVDSKALSAGRDPAPNETKRLIITYKVKGTDQTATWTEGHTLELSRFNGSGL